MVGYSPWGHKESDTTELLHFHKLCCKKQNLEFPGSPEARTLYILTAEGPVQSLVGELNDHKLRGMAKTKKREREKPKSDYCSLKTQGFLL